MPVSKTIIAAFDFDGTITTKDTLFDFIKSYAGTKKLYKGLIILSPILISYKLGLIKNDIAKQKLFSHFFKGKSLEQFNKISLEYAQRIQEITRSEVLEKVRWHQSQKHTVVIVSASIANWIEPWAKEIGIETVLATKILIKDNLIEGSFSSANCYGQEKVNRLLKEFPNRNEYTLYAYGDSAGDRELFALADYSTLIK